VEHVAVTEDLLVSDFEQCFEQLRHYDEDFKKTAEYFFGAAGAVTIAATALIAQFKIGLDTAIGIALLLTLTASVGLLSVFYLSRNRVYFAFCARYVNEVRSEYLKAQPAGVRNKAGLYDDPSKPPIYNPTSTQAMYLYACIICSSVIIGAAAQAYRCCYLLSHDQGLYVSWPLMVVVFACSLAVQLLWALQYWQSKDATKSAGAAIWGD
jgi:hypothetical protein